MKPQPHSGFLISKSPNYLSYMFPLASTTACTHLWSFWSQYNDSVDSIKSR